VSDDQLPDLTRMMAKLRFDPLGHATAVFPWGQPGTALEKWRRPRDWQGKVKLAIRNHLVNPETRYQPLRIAVASGHGIGKSAEIAMLSKWALDCWVDARIVCTANTEQQLLTKTSPEIAKWHKMSLTRDMFDYAAMKISSIDPNRKDTWRMDLVTWSANNTEAFAGLHNYGKLILVMMDEAAGIDDEVHKVTLGALTDEDTVIIWVAFGNPTKNSGWFREAFGKHRKLWKTMNIDARDVEGTNKQYLQSLVDTYGIDSDIVKVRVLGQFPSASSMQFIGTALVEAAMERQYNQGAILPSDPVIFGLDHARFGDDSTVLAIRQGRDTRSRPWMRWSGATSMEIAGDVNAAMREYFPDAVFVDAGGPNAGGVIDQLRLLNPQDEPGACPIFEINFGSKTKDMTALISGENRVRVANKRAQMWQKLKTWLSRGVLPEPDNDPDSIAQRIRDDLIGPEYSYDASQAIILEKKEHMKERGLPSPDYGDALALTFAEDVAPRQVPEYLNPENYGRTKEFDRFAELETAIERGGDYDRYGEIR
jgi:hypothetical protein